MKTSGVCTKCACRKLYVVEQVTQPDPNSVNSTQALWLMAAPVAKRDTGTAEGTSYRSHACMLEAWVCSACSYTELYGKNVSDLQMLADHPDGGVRVHQTAASPAYR